jgi:hypothetical protein
MKYPKLPEPTIIDGRMFYTAGDMRTFAKLAIEINSDFEDDYEPSTQPQNSKSVDDLLNIFGMK